MRRITSHRYFFIASSILLLLAIVSPITPSISHASSKTTLFSQRAQASTTLYNNLTLPKPPWWNGNQCDSTYYNNSPYNPTHQQAVPLGTTRYRGEVACGPMPFNFTPPLDVPVNFYTDAPTENEWECTELVKRYLYQAFGAPDLGNTPGKDVVNNYTNPANNTLFQNFPNNNPPTVAVAPASGDVLSFAATSNNSSGHTALVYTSRVNGTGNGTLSILEQNNTHDTQGTGTLFVGNPNGQDPGNKAWHIDTEKGYLGAVTGWLHPNTLVASANANSNFSLLNAVDAIGAHNAKTTDLSNVWAVGDTAVNNVRQTLIERWDGAHWSVIPNTPNLGNGDDLYGVAVLSPTNIWAVGSYLDNSRVNQTLFLHYNGKGWFASTHGPGELYAITRVSGSEAWAVGNNDAIPQTELTYHLVGSTWTPVTDTSVNVVLSAVSASSATNVWAVGSSTVGSLKTVTLHWTGGPTWNVVASPNPGNPGTALNGVTAIDANTAWAVGRGDSTSGFGFIIKWTSQSGWGQPFILPNSSLVSVSALSKTNVWAVGSGVTGTLVERYNGSEWKQIPSVDIGTDHFASVMVNRANGNVWAVGQYQTYGVQAQTLTEFFN